MSPPAFKPQTCTCGHAAGDHSSGGAHGLHKVSRGFCWITGCDCKHFTDQEHSHGRDD